MTERIKTYGEEAKRQAYYDSINETVDTIINEEIQKRQAFDDSIVETIDTIIKTTVSQ